MLAQKLTELMIEHEITLKDLSVKSGVSLSYLADLRKGTKKNPSAVVLIRIAKSFELPVTYFIDIEEKEM